jgi:hypothetical protein
MRSGHRFCIYTDPEWPQPMKSGPDLGPESLRVEYKDEGTWAVRWCQCQCQGATCSVVLDVVIDWLEPLFGYRNCATITSWRSWWC